MPLVGPPFWFEFDSDFDGKAPPPHQLQLRKLVGDLLAAIDDKKNYPEDPVELQLKMTVTEQDLRRLLSEFKNDGARAD
jgi:hypothetical protein